MAEKFVYISVADYVPMRIFGEREYWPLIDDRLKMGMIFCNLINPIDGRKIC